MRFMPEMRLQSIADLGAQVSAQAPQILHGFGSQQDLEPHSGQNLARFVGHVKTPLQPNLSSRSAGFGDRRRLTRLHSVGEGDAEEAGEGGEAALEDVDGGQAGGAELGVLFLEDGVAVVNGVELLGEVVDVAGE